MPDLLPMGGKKYSEYVEDVGRLAADNRATVIPDLIASPDSLVVWAFQNRSTAFTAKSMEYTMMGLGSSCGLLRGCGGVWCHWSNELSLKAAGCGTRTARKLGVRTQLVLGCGWKTRLGFPFEPSLRGQRLISDPHHLGHKVAALVQRLIEDLGGVFAVVFAK